MSIPTYKFSDEGGKGEFNKLVTRKEIESYKYSERVPVPIICYGCDLLKFKCWRCVDGDNIPGRENSYTIICSDCVNASI